MSFLKPIPIQDVQFNADRHGFMRARSNKDEFIEAQSEFDVVLTDNLDENYHAFGN